MNETPGGAVAAPGGAVAAPMTETTGGAVVAADLRKSYRSRAGEVRALDGLSFSVAAGSVFALVGPNGAGKTTAVRVLTTLSRPDQGRATVAGLDVLAHPARTRSVIGVVSQHSGAVGQLTGYENVALQGKMYGLPPRELRRRVPGLLERFGLSEAAQRQAATYSGGMRRRLDVAIALVHRPAVLFLDEPTTGLDPEGRTELWAVLTRLAADAGTTILLTTHYLEEADRYADVVAITDRGRVVAEGTPDQLKARLQGDSVLLELGDASQVAQAKKALIPHVRQTTAAGTTLRTRVADRPRALPTLLAALDAESIAVLSVTVARPSLDEVYLHYAGRSFRQAEGSAAA